MALIRLNSIFGPVRGRYRQHQHQAPTYSRATELVLSGMISHTGQEYLTVGKRGFCVLLTSLRHPTDLDTTRTITEETLVLNISRANSNPKLRNNYALRRFQGTRFKPQALHVLRSKASRPGCAGSLPVLAQNNNSSLMSRRVTYRR